MYEARQNKEKASRRIDDEVGIRLNQKDYFMSFDTSRKKLLHTPHHTFKNIQRTSINIRKNGFIKYPIIQKEDLIEQVLNKVQISNFIKRESKYDNIIDNILKVEYSHEMRAQLINEINKQIQVQIVDNSPSETFIYGYFVGYMGAGACDEISSIVFAKLLLCDDFKEIVYKCNILGHAFNVIYNIETNNINNIDSDKAIVIDVWGNMKVSLKSFLNGENCYKRTIKKDEIQIDSYSEKHINKTILNKEIKPIIDKYVKQYQAWKNENKNKILRNIDFTLLYLDESIESIINILKIIRYETNDSNKAYNFIINKFNPTSLSDWICLYNCCSEFWDAEIVRKIIISTLNNKAINERTKEYMKSILDGVAKDFLPPIK